MTNGALEPMNLETLEEFVEELELPSARGGRRKAADGPITISTVRQLTEADVPTLLEPLPATSLPSIPQIRHQHHQIAGLIAKGVKNAEISLITGFSASYISVLRNAPDMKELIEYYHSQEKERTIDALARLRNLGIASIEELQHRLNEAPDKFTVGQLTMLVELGIIKPVVAAAGAKAERGAAPFEININFKAPEEALSHAPGVLIEGEIVSGT